MQVFRDMETDGQDEQQAPPSPPVQQARQTDEATGTGSPPPQSSADGPLAPEGHRHLRERRPPTLRREPESYSEQHPPAPRVVTVSARGASESHGGAYAPWHSGTGLSSVSGSNFNTFASSAQSRDFAPEAAQPTATFPPPLRRSSGHEHHASSRENSFNERTRARPRADRPYVEYQAPAREQSFSSFAPGPRVAPGRTSAPAPERRRVSDAPNVYIANTYKSPYADSDEDIDVYTRPERRVYRRERGSGSESSRGSRGSIIRVHDLPARQIERYRPYPRGEEVSDSDVFDEFEGFITSKAFEFTPSRSSSRSRSKSEVGSDGDTSGRAFAPASPPPVEATVVNGVAGSPTARSSVLDVYSSKYAGDALSDGAHLVTLTVLRGTRGRSKPLFRWRHLQQDIMDFQELSNEAVRLPDLSDGDRNGLVRLLAEVKRTCVKTKHTSEGFSVRYMDPSRVQMQLPDEGSKGQPARTRYATFICMPYFSLGKYSGLLSAAKNPSLFPNQTLLQAQYSRINRERDMQQVVCQMKNATSGFCFHISQLWCVVVDNSYLITCGDVSAASIQGDLIRVVEEPLKQGPGSNSQPRILVYYGDYIVWAIPIEECPTWFLFLTHFHDFWPQTLRFLHHDRAISAEDWPRIINLARHSTAAIMLTLKLTDPPAPPTRGTLKPLTTLPPQSPKQMGSPQPGLRPPKGKVTVKSRTEQDAEDVDKFHVFTWLEPPLLGTTTAAVDLEALKKQLQEVDDYLSKEICFTDKKAYQDCEEATRRSLFAYLEEQGVEIGKLKRVPRRKQEYEDAIDILNAADVLFRFFLPVGADGPVVKKYWGAVSPLIQLSPPLRTMEGTRARRRSDQAPQNAPLIRKALRRLTQAIQSFTALLGFASDADRARVVVPNEFVLAWLHLLMALIHSSTDADMWRNHFDFAENLITTGMRAVMDGLSNVDLLDKAVILPMDIVSMICLTLFKDMTNAHTNISETYSEYLQALECDITTSADRYTQHRINLLKQELLIIRRTIEAETTICSVLMPQILKGEPWDSTARVFPKQRLSHLTSAPIRVRHISPEAVYSTQLGYFKGGGGGGDGLPRERPRLETGRRRRDMYEPETPRYEYPERPRPRGSDSDYMEPWAGDYVASSGLNAQEYWRLPSTWRGGFRALLALDCVRVLQRRSLELWEFEQHAKSLEEDNMNKVDLTKDRQEMAIYAFTIVTVIFLPLSAVASIFGMNTADIRDMDLGQWAYWAAAVPVTIFVIVIGLWWMGELGNAFTWLGLRRKGFAARASAAASYALIPPYDPRMRPAEPALRGVRELSVPPSPPPPPLLPPPALPPSGGSPIQRRRRRSYR